MYHMKGLLQREHSDSHTDTSRSSEHCCAELDLVPAYSGNHEEGKNTVPFAPCKLGPCVIFQEVHPIIFQSSSRMIFG